MTISPEDRLTRMLAESGCDFVEPPLLHDADLFLDLAGEDLRRRMFLTTTNDGTELCLRPDYTIPVGLHHLTTGAPNRAATYAYCGSVFRQRPGETGEFRQAGVESIGRPDAMNADADMLALALKSVGLFDVTDPAIHIGDSGLFQALLESLSLPDVWRRRLARAFGDNALLGAQLDELSGKTVRPRPANAAIPPDLELADRFVEQAELGAGSESDIAVVDVLRRFLAISGPPDEAAMTLGELAAERAPGLATAVARFTQRLGGLVGHGIDVDRMDFSADFGRRLDYYTGFVFELSVSAQEESKPLAGGGRYDRLLSLIRKRDGSVLDVPAVGFALWLDRLEAAAS